MPHTADGVLDTKAPYTMTIRRRLALLTSVLALAALAPTLSASAQSDDAGTPPPVDPVEPIIDEQGNEIVHSWALAPAGTEEANGVGNRSNLSYVADPGTVIEDAVTLYNLSNVPLVFRIYATDAFNNPDGEFDLLEADEVPVDAGSWVDMGAEQIPVDARTQVTIPITITIPENATPGDHAGAVLASNAALSTGPEGQQLTLDRRTGTQLFVRVNGPLTAELAIADITTDYSASLNPLSGSATVSYTIENRGNVSLDGTVQASVGGPLGLGEQKGAEIELPLLLPGSNITLTEEFDNVPAFGVAVTKVQLNPSSDGDVAVAASSQQTITFAPPIALLMFLLAILFGLLAWRAYRRHQQRSAAEFASEPESLEHEREPEHQPT
jgi:hypothetical protein